VPLHNPALDGYQAIKNRSSAVEASVTLIIDLFGQSQVGRTGLKAFLQIIHKH
jgi:hypothetical protein